tara:strand:- start:239 stop:3256 length:3018 start_codon:yes stop_codon:yes gene_type:complete
MKSLPNIDQAQIAEVFAKPFLAKLKEEIRLQQELLRKTDEIYETYHQKLNRLDSDKEMPKYINETDWLKTTLYQLLDKEFPEKREILFEEEFKAFHESGTHFLKQQETEVEVEQSLDRFKPITGDSAWVASLKPFKHFCFLLSRIPQKAANLFRKEKKPIKRWSQKVPVRNLMHHYFLNQFILLELPIFKELQELKCDALNLKWSIDRDINIEVSQFIENKEGAKELLEHIDGIAERNRIEEKIENLNQKFKQWEIQVNETISSLIQQYEEAASKVDTFELSRLEFSDSKILAGQKNYQNGHLRLFNGWRNTLFAQLDDFQLDIEFYHLKYNSLLQFFLLQNSCKLRISKTLKENIQEITSLLNEVVSKIDINKIEAKQVEEILLTEKKRLKYQLESVVIPQTIESLYNQNLPYLLDRLELKIKDQINRMKDKRIIYGRNEYNAPISKSDLSHFNPRELVLIDAFKKFSERNMRIKTDLIARIEKLQTEIKEFGGIIDYNLDSALSSAQESSENIKEIAIDGVERSKAKVEVLQKDLQSIQELINTKLRDYIDDFNSELIKLTDNENITALRIQLTKARAIEKTKTYRKNIINNIRTVVPTTYRFAKAKLNKLSHYLLKLLKQFGIIDEKQELTAELSEFLSKSEAAIEKLPYVYRRLYRVEPLTEDTFFEGRSKELESLKNAYKNWEEGQFSNCCIIGEKGSGASSLINFFLEGKDANKIIRKKFFEAYSSKHDFFSFFNILLGKTELNDIDSLSNYLMESSIDIIILEDVQHFFLKKLNGFEALNLLFELMSRTSKKVFWCTEISTYTWRYLERTISIQRYFKHPIVLKTLSEEQIVQLIMKRHRVSGYNLTFEASFESRSEERKIKRKTEEEQQAYLKNKFFDGLNAFAQSNISLALLYWIRSTQKVENNTIHIGELKNMQFDFLRNLNDQYIFTLHNLLIHDSLNIEEHAQLFHQSQKQSKMTLMVLEDNGVLKITEGRYYINRLLYRQTVNVLKQKNILH